MTFQEAKNLRLGDTIFVIDRGDKVYEKRVIGIRLQRNKQVNVIYTDTLLGDTSHVEVFLKEKDALEVVLHKKEANARDISLELSIIRKKLNTLTEE